ncbi:MAG: tripartite tricarboxylate transporter substrate binding protein [Pseudomonadota bacterium]
MNAWRLRLIAKLSELLFLCASIVVSAIAHAAERPKQAATDYPSKAIRIILPLSAGGSADTIARMVGDTFANAFRQSVVVDNRPGANGIIGIDLVAKATPDGYTLLVASGANLTVNPVLHGAKLPFNVERDLVAITHVASQTFIAHVSPVFPAHSIKELIAYAKAKPGVVNYASAGTGSTAHLMAALFESITAIKMTHVPYKGALQGRTAVMAREVDLMFDGLLASLPLIKAGRLRGLAITSAKRSVVAPDIPTIAEAGVPGYSADAWYGLLAPRGTPPAVVTQLSTTLANALDTPAVREKLIAQGVEPVGGTPEQFRAFLKAEMGQWGKVMREAGIRAE